MRRTLIALSFIAAACGNTDELPDGADLSAELDALRGPDLAENPDLLPPRIARVNIIASGSSFIQPFSYGPTCSRTFSGSCELVECPSGSADGYFAGARYDNEGVVTVSSGAMTTMLTPGADGRYANGSLSLSAGAMVHLAAAGDTIPAYATDVVIPPPLTPIGPSPFSSTSPSRSTDIVARFQPATGLDVILSLGGGNTSAVCIASAAGGSLTIPAALASRLRPGNNYWTLASIDYKDVVVGSFSIQVRGVNAAPSGSNGTVTLQ